MTPDVITIKDAESGATASILTVSGFNCFSFKPVISGEPVEVLWAQPEFGPESMPDLSGIPILFPFGGRMTGGAFTFDGIDYQTPSAPAHGPNSMHGFVLRRPWRVTERAGNRVVGEFQASVDGPELLEQWPADFTISVAYEVTGQELRAEFTMSNPDLKRLPFIFATHPYFQLSLGGGQPEAARLTVPASTYWALKDLIPDGERLPVDERNDLRDGPALAGRKLNDIYSGLEYENGEFRCEVLDPISGRKTTQITSDDFNCCVVYTHFEREAIAIESYIGVPDAFRLEEAGVSTRMKILEPGEEYRTTIVIRLD
jgi:aldose 1-epimerase